MEVVSTADHFVITSSPCQPSTVCLACAQVSQRLHGRYQRTLADLPWQGSPVALQVAARRFRCVNLSCTHQIFAERLAGVADEPKFHAESHSTWLPASGGWSRS